MAGGTNYRVFAPEVWSDYIKVYFKSALFAAKFFKNYTSDLLAQGGDTITLPNLTEGPSATALTTTTGAITDYIITETRTQLTVNNWIHQSKKFSYFDLSRIKSNYNLQRMYLKDDIIPKLAKTLDTALIGQTSQAGSIQLHTGTSLVAISNTTITEAIRIAESYSCPIGEMAFFMHPNTYWGQLFRRTALIDASQLGKTLVAAPDGSIHPLGSLYGRPVYVTNQVGLASGLGTDGYPITVRRNLFVHPRSIAYAYGKMTPNGPEPFDEAQKAVADALAVRAGAHLMYGAAIPGSSESVRLMTVA
jgi:hypothetical protein